MESSGIPLKWKNTSRCENSSKPFTASMVNLCESISIVDSTSPQNSCLMARTDFESSRDLPTHRHSPILFVQPFLQWRKIFQDCAGISFSLTSYCFHRFGPGLTLP